MLTGIVMVATRLAVFNSYNGTDDLHYAMLSAKMLQGTFNPFEAGDIFSGRFLLIAWQALWFKLFGINDLSMQMPAVTGLIALAYLLCFNRAATLKPAGIIFITSLIYYNPEVLHTTLANMPDVYIAVITAAILLILHQQVRHDKRGVKNGIAVAALLATGIFIKETIVFVGLMTALLLFIYRKDLGTPFLISVISSLALLALCTLSAYYDATGDWFFRYRQITQSSYYNACSYQCFDAAVLQKRLTITMPMVFIQAGLFPILLAVPALFCIKRNNDTAKFYAAAFVGLLLCSFYFPVSINPYLPLCHDVRHFFFLVPAGALLMQAAAINIHQKINTFFACTTGLLLICLAVTWFNYSYAKWLLVIYILLLAVAVAGIFIKSTANFKQLLLLTSVIFWASIAYQLYKRTDLGYAGLKQAVQAITFNNKQIQPVYYFIDHDTRSHVQLINKFNPASAYICLDTSVYKVFRQYEQRPAKFTPGWLIINPLYTGRSAAEITATLNILQENFIPVKTFGAIQAGYVATAAQYAQIGHIINPQPVPEPCH